MKTITISILSMLPEQLAYFNDTLRAWEQCMRIAKKQLKREGIECNFGWHIDIMDGKYVKPIAFCPQMLTSVLSTVTMPCDLHFMTDSLELYKPCIELGKTVINKQYIHFATDAILSSNTDDLTFNLDENPMSDALLSECKSVLLMSVVPGKGGQQYNSVKQRIEYIQAFNRKKNASIEVNVDGGVNLSTITDCIEADKVVIGSAFTRLGTDTNRCVDFLVSAAKAFC